jgi:hypothetical protein
MREAMDQPETAAKLAEPMKVTRERLSEIGDAWMAFAKNRTAIYKSKLPPTLSQLLKLKPKTPVSPSETASAQGVKA